MEARVGFEPTSDGFADHSLRPLGYRALFVMSKIYAQSYAQRALFLPIHAVERLANPFDITRRGASGGILQTSPLVHLGTAPFLRIQRLLQYPLRPTCCQICCHFRAKSSPYQSAGNAATPHRPPAAPFPAIGGRSVSWLYVHLRAPVDPAPPSSLCSTVVWQ